VREGRKGRDSKRLGRASVWHLGPCRPVTQELIVDVQFSVVYYMKMHTRTEINMSERDG
jgi:hypothetical protein